MQVTQALHRRLQEPDRPLTVYDDRVRTVAESADRSSRAGARCVGLLSVTGFRSASVLGSQSSQLATDHVARPRSCRAAALDPVRGMHERAFRSAGCRGSS